MEMRALLLASALACAGDEEDSGEPPRDSEPRDEEEGCETLEIFHDGEDEPIVGESWTVLLHCDGAAVIGASVIAVDPVDFATIVENTVTWTTAGTGTLSVQTGRLKAEEEVTVAKSR